jgi:hypothetical protein
MRTRSSHAIPGPLLFTLAERHRPNIPFNHPTDIAVASNGDLYFSDGYVLRNNGIGARD